VLADVNGDGLGNRMDNPTNIAVDDAGNVYVAAFFSDNAFQIPLGGTPIQIIDATGDGSTAYGGASDFALAIDSLGNVYVGGIEGDAAFRIVPP
jgi:DNA-binding beta-propeller fold protein YncE